MSNWKEFRQELNITPEEEKIIELEKDLLRTMVTIREEQGLSQSELADKCNVKQPVIARANRTTTDYHLWHCPSTCLFPDNFRIYFHFQIAKKLILPAFFSPTQLQPILPFPSL